MTVTVQIIYAADRTTSYIDKVPRKSTIATVKKLIAKMYRPGTCDSLRLIQCGEVLDDSQTLSTLSFSDDSSIVLYATGVPTKVQEVRRTAPPKVESFFKRYKILFAVAGLVMFIGIFLLIVYEVAIPHPTISLGAAVSFKVDTKFLAMILFSTIIGSLLAIIALDFF
jgi:hypothetical protein